MPHRHRRGSAILYCIALATIALVIGYGLLRSLSTDTVAADSSYRFRLAQAAARDGVTHASEQILAGYANPVALATGGTTTITFLDAPYRVPFQAAYRPETLVGVDANRSLEDDDVRAEEHLLSPLVSRLDAYRGQWHGQGILVSNARGRWIEPDWCNVARLPPATPPPTPAGWPGTWAQPVAPVRFSDLAAPPPERSGGLFLDKQLRRVRTGSPATDRETARYRLRYAVSVTDLGGHLLANPRPDMDVDWRHAANAYRQPDAALRRAEQGWYNLCTVFPPLPNDTNAGHDHDPAFNAPRWAHVFLGRGNAANFDRAPPTVPGDASTGGYPVTFPRMFRRIAQPNDEASPWWGFYANRQEAGSAPSYPVSSLYAYAGHSVPDAAGGQPLEAGWNAGTTYRPFISTMFGPQLSWFNLYASVMGVEPQAPTGGGGYNSDGVGWGDILAYQNSQIFPTPFGHGQIASSIVDPAARSWYDGKVDCPWLVNVLTAPPQTIQCMLLAYLPPQAKAFAYGTVTEARFRVIRDAGGNVTGWSSTPDHGWEPVTAPLVWPFGSPVHQNAVMVTNGPNLCGHDLFTALAGPAFDEYPEPTDPTQGGIVNYLSTDTRPASQRYPGRLWNAAYATPWPILRPDTRPAAVANDALGGDDLGKDIDVDQHLMGRGSHTGCLFFPELRVPSQPSGTGYSESSMYIDMNGAPALTHLDTPAGSPTSDSFLADGRNMYKWRVSSPPAHPTGWNSYWWDICQALSTTVATARAAWVQYPTDYLAPTSAFSPAGLRDPGLFDSIDKLDRFFLNQLGENYDTPGDGVPLAPVLCGYNAGATSGGPQYGQQTYTRSAAPVSNTIRTLVAGDRIAAGAATSAERGKIMERVLNDVRMSFFGSSPQYQDGFRPFDFDGDGRVQCSCYDRNPSASADERDWGTDRWQTVVAAGRGPEPAHWFSLTGSFYVGKSHYFRIISRGEVFDNVLAVPVTQATLDAVLCVDPEGHGDLGHSQYLYQRWHYDRYVGMLTSHDHH